MLSTVIPLVWEYASPWFAAVPVEEIALGVGLIVSTAGLVGVNWSYSHRPKATSQPTEITIEEFRDLMNGKKTRWDE